MQGELSGRGCGRFDSGMTQPDHRSQAQHWWPGAFHDPANAEFVDGASYYLGEMLRRGYPSRWVYRDFLDEGDRITANFKIQLNDDAGYTGPYHLLSLMVRRGNPGHTRDYYDVWVG
jgi:hypothetical protein